MVGFPLPPVHCRTDVQEEILCAVDVDNLRVDEVEARLPLALHSRPDNVVDFDPVPDEVRLGHCVAAEHQFGTLQELIGWDGARVEVQPESVVVHEALVYVAGWGCR